LKGVKYKMIKPYDFVPFLPYKPYDDVKAERGDGKIPIRVKTLTPVHISSGEYTVSGDNSMIYKEFVKVNGVPVIPGTSFKGCIRSIAESISYSCLYIFDKQKKELIPEFKLEAQEKDHEKNKEQRNENGKKCIVSDMFGMPGQKSKIVFNDLRGVPNKYKLEIKGIPTSFRPNPDAEYYLENGKYKGYKFYKHGINGIQPKGNMLCEFVAENSLFEGEIIYKNLTEEQIRLLCFSLGLSGDINPKIGYGKNYFYGSIEVTSDAKWVEKAKQYKNIEKDDIKNNINLIISILNYKNAVTSVD